ncbi:MAG: IS30 family transposase, partial [Mycobacteriales bacterium]
LDDIAAELNGRPRQTLKWKTPDEKLDELLITTMSHPPLETNH